MKPIDLDASGKRFIQNVSTQPRSVLAKNNDAAAVVSQKTAKGQIADLLRLVQNTPETPVENTRINQLIKDIKSDTYSIDFDALTDEIIRDLMHE